MEQKSTSENEKFYQELDEKKSHKSCCTCQTLAILTGVIIIISGGVLFYLYRQVKDISNYKDKKITFTKNSEEKISSIRPDKNNKIKLVLSSDDLTDMISSGISTEKIILKDTFVAVNSKNILVYGNLVKPLSTKVVFEIVPKVEEGRINFQIQKLTAGELSLPSFVFGGFNDNVSVLLNSRLDSLYEKYEIEKVQLGENQIIIFGKLKGK